MAFRGRSVSRLADRHSSAPFRLEQISAKPPSMKQKVHLGRQEGRPACPHKPLHCGAPLEDQVGPTWVRGDLFPVPEMLPPMIIISQGRPDMLVIGLVKSHPLSSHHSDRGDAIKSCINLENFSVQSHGMRPCRFHAVHWDESR
jgi:hypothetical protein